jgi:hypothetical protein
LEKDIPRKSGCGVELVERKLPAAEIVAGGRWKKSDEQPSKEMRLHFNQYRDGMQRMKQ